MEVENSKNKKEKLFVGYCRMALVDADGLGKHLKGCHVEGPLHYDKVEVGGAESVVLTMCLSKDDPIDFLRLGFDDTELLTGRWCIGALRKADEHPNPNRTICSLQTVTCKKLNEMLSNDSCKDGVLHCSAVLRMIKNAFEKPVAVKLHTIDYKLTTRVTKVEVVIPLAIYQEWQTYYDALKEFEKEDKDKDKDKKKDKDGDKEDAED